MMNSRTELSVLALTTALMFCAGTQAAFANVIVPADTSFAVREDVPGDPTSRLLDDTPFGGALTDGPGTQGPARSSRG